MKTKFSALSIAVAAILLTIPWPSSAVYQVQHCRTTETCTGSGSARSCSSGQVCWNTWEFTPVPPFVSDPIINRPGVNLPWRPPDVDSDATTDCWKNVTIGANGSSGFPYRNDGTTAHNGIDVTSTAPNYGRGAPVGSLGAGYVREVGFSEANGNFVRVDQGDGNTVTYIHLLQYNVRKDQEVRVGTQIGEMNCTGNCGATQGPERGKINHTHVHIQVKRTNDPSMFLDAMDLYGGENCSVSPNSDPTPARIPRSAVPICAQRIDRVITSISTAAKLPLAAA